MTEYKRITKDTRILLINSTTQEPEAMYTSSKACSQSLGIGVIYVNNKLLKGIKVAKHIPDLVNHYLMYAFDYELEHNVIFKGGKTLLK